MRDNLTEDFPYCGMSDKYYITSNRKSGEGRFDIQFMPKVPTLPGFLIEVKAEKDCAKENLLQGIFLFDD